MPKASKKKFTANVKVTTIVGVTIIADTLEEALTVARKFTAYDCIEHIGENVDSESTLIGVSSDEWM